MVLWCRTTNTLKTWCLSDMSTAEGSTYTPVAVDLFCGVGGLSYGFQQAGIDVLAGIDIDSLCRHPYQTNVGAAFHEKDISDVSAAFVKSLFGDRSQKILAGCAPCQPYSSYTRGKSIERDDWNPLEKFGELVAELQPEVVTMENVPLLRGDGIFDDFLTGLESEDYSCSVKVVRCAEYGVPQTRRRLVLLASKLGPIELIPPTHSKEKFKTVKDTIHSLDELVAGEPSETDPLHRSSALGEDNLKRIQNSVPGGTWRDWDESLVSSCHKKDSGKSYGSVYGRMEWDKPAPTITSQFYGYGNGRFGHPEQDRALSLREGALLQTFPKDYSFTPKGEVISMTAVGRMIGNAVPVLLGEVIGKSIVSHLNTHQVRLDH